MEKPTGSIDLKQNVILVFQHNSHLDKGPGTRRW